MVPVKLVAMHVWSNWGHVLLPAMIAVPVAVLVVVALARWRTSRGTPRGAAWPRSVAEVGLVVGTLPWLWMVLTPKPAARQVTLIPLHDLVDLVGDDPADLAVQIVGNVLVLAAFGAFLPMRWAGMRTLSRVAAAALLASATIEVLQYALQLGRVTSVDDMLLNTAGAIAGATLSRRWWSTRPPAPR